MYDTHGHRITAWNNQPFLSPANLERYARAITRNGSPLTNCFGFIYGTVHGISRPGEHQRVLYNGRKRVHALKFQSVTIPNGLIANLYGPVVMMLGCWKNLVFWTYYKEKHAHSEGSLFASTDRAINEALVMQPIYCGKNVDIFSILIFLVEHCTFCRLRWVS